MSPPDVGMGQTPARLGKRAVTNPRAGIWPEVAVPAAVLGRMPNLTFAHFRDNSPATDPKFIEAYLDGLKKAGPAET